MKTLMVLFMMAVPTQAADIRPFTAQDYRRFTPDVQASFAGGYLLGYVQSAETARRTVENALIANGFKIVGSEVDTKQQLSCPFRLLRTINFGQAYAILDKYIADHPERWDKDMNVLAEEAFIDACEKSRSISHGVKLLKYFLKIHDDCWIDSENTRRKIVLEKVRVI